MYVYTILFIIHFKYHYFSLVFIFRSPYSCSQTSIKKCCRNIKYPYILLVV